MDSFDDGEVQFGGDSFENPFDDIKEMHPIETGKMKDEQNSIEFQAEDGSVPPTGEQDLQIDDEAQ